MQGTTNLVELAAALAAAKSDESAAKNRRIEAEEAIIQVTGFDKAEGQESYEEDNDSGSCKLTLKQPIRTTVDSDAWLKLRRTLDKNHPARGVFKAKYDLRTKEARELQNTDKPAWVAVADVISRKPGKVSVEIKSVVISAGQEAS